MKERGEREGEAGRERAREREIEREREREGGGGERGGYFNQIQPLSRSINI